MRQVGFEPTIPVFVKSVMSRFEGTRSEIGRIFQSFLKIRVKFVQDVYGAEESIDEHQVEASDVTSSQSHGGPRKFHYMSHSIVTSYLSWQLAAFKATSPGLVQ
jgi:hypothetical protein